MGNKKKWKKKPFDYTIGRLKKKRFPRALAYFPMELTIEIQSYIKNSLSSSHGRKEPI